MFLKDLYKEQMEDDSMESYIVRVLTAKYKLAKMGVPVDNMNIKTAIITGVLPKHTERLSYMRNQAEELDLDDFIDQIETT